MFAFAVPQCSPFLSPTACFSTWIQVQVCDQTQHNELHPVTTSGNLQRLLFWYLFLILHTSITRISSVLHNEMIVLTHSHVYIIEAQTSPRGKEDIQRNLHVKGVRYFNRSALLAYCPYKLVSRRQRGKWLTWSTRECKPPPRFRVWAIASRSHPLSSLSMSLRRHIKLYVLPTPARTRRTWLITLSSQTLGNICHNERHSERLGHAYLVVSNWRCPSSFLERDSQRRAQNTAKYNINCSPLPCDVVIIIWKNDPLCYTRGTCLKMWITCRHYIKITVVLYEYTSI